jgi:5-methylthioadenosine/S-adenosylhomocysteine deaminase
VAGPTEVDLLIQNGVVITLDGDRRILYDGGLAINGQSIVNVGPASWIAEQYTGLRTLDARGKAVMPGLIDTHHHFLQTFLKGSRDDLPFVEWIDQVSAPLISMAVSDYLAGDIELQRQATRLGAVQALRSGITCVLNMEWATPPQLIDVYEEMGLRAVHTLYIADVDQWGNPGMLLPLDATMELAERLIQRCQSSPGGRVSFRYGPACENSVSPDLLRRIRRLADHHGVGVHMHVAESKLSWDNIHDRFGVTPVQYLHHLGVLGPDLLAAHCIWLSEEDVAILADTGTAVSYSPECHMKVALGIAPIVKLLRAGVPVSLGIDSSAVNDNMDLFEAARVGALLQKIETMDPAVVPAAQALEMATIGGATALGMDVAIGSLEPGKRADVILVDLSEVHMRPINNILNNLVYCASAPGDISDVIVDGELLVHDHQLRHFDERQLVAEAESFLDSRLTAAGRRLSAFYCETHSGSEDAKD